MLSRILLGSTSACTVAFSLQICSSHSILSTIVGRRTLRLYSTGKKSSKSKPILAQTEDKKPPKSKSAKKASKKKEPLDSHDQEPEEINTKSKSIFPWKSLAAAALCWWLLPRAEKELKPQVEAQETSPTVKRANPTPQRTNILHTIRAIQGIFDEEMERLISTTTTRADTDDYMKRMIAGVRVASRVPRPDPNDTRSVHNYLRRMVLVMDLITFGTKPEESTLRELVEVSYFEPKTFRKLVESSHDPSILELAEKAEKQLHEIQLQACWEIYEALHPESHSKSPKDDGDQHIYEVYVEEVVGVMMNSLKAARCFAPVFKDVVARAKAIDSKHHKGG